MKNKKVSSCSDKEQHICFHPEGHLRGEELKQYKRAKALKEALHIFDESLRKINYKVAELYFDKKKNRLMRIEELKSKKVK